jgi:hypothetical protein
MGSGEPPSKGFGPPWFFRQPHNLPMSEVPRTTADLGPCLRATVRERRKILILDGRRFPQQGHAPVGCRTSLLPHLGKGCNRQVAVTAGP